MVILLIMISSKKGTQKVEMTLLWNLMIMVFVSSVGSVLIQEELYLGTKN